MSMTYRQSRFANPAGNTSVIKVHRAVFVESLHGEFSFEYMVCRMPWALFMAVHRVSSKPN
jgi:hypothetical protein